MYIKIYLILNNNKNTSMDMNTMKPLYNKSFKLYKQKNFKNW